MEGGEGMKILPIGIQTFSEIINRNCYYVDKTNFALSLIQKGKYYFLSRPRRFGKTLFVDTLAEIFLGNKELFSGLYIYDKYNFTSYPVIRITFGSGDYTGEGSIYKEIERIFERNERELNIKCKDKSDPRGCLEELIYKTYKKYDKQVVILIDEYDKPILDNITNIETAKKARNILRNFYGTLKDNDKYIRFVFITGVSKFSKLNLFSGLNNLEDITLNTDYAEICGYTNRDLIEVFGDLIRNIDLEQVRKWYNGYNYFKTPLYNPFDILLFISNKYEFRNYWWGTGNPKFLIDKLKEGTYYIPEIENSIITEEGLESFDIEYIDPVALLWQTGYLTFEDRFYDEAGGLIYKLKVPNLEIQLSLNQLFIDYLTNQKYEKIRYRLELQKLLKMGKVEDFIALLRIIFAKIPYTNYANNIIAKYEGYYSSVIFVYLMALGYEVIPEDITNKGRIDLTLKTENNIVILEFKVDISEPAIKQIKEKKYYEKYINEGKTIYIIGINFDSKEKNISSYAFEKIR